MTDGKLRKITLSELKPGMVLRPIDMNGYTAPFSDVVVTRVQDGHFDVARPYAFHHFGGELHGVERVNYCSEQSLDRYQAVLLASGKVYTCSIE